MEYILIDLNKLCLHEHNDKILCVHFLGNKALHLLTSGTKQELRVDLQKFSGKKAYAKYSTFSVGSGSHKYKLTIGGYRGTAGKIIREKEKLTICYEHYEMHTDYLFKTN